MSYTAGRHRARRSAALPRPTVLTTATLSVLAVSAAGYAGAGQMSAAQAAPSERTAGQVPGGDTQADAGSSAAASARLQARAAARAEVARRQAQAHAVQLERQRAVRAALGASFSSADLRMRSFEAPKAEDARAVAEQDRSSRRDTGSTRGADDQVSRSSTRSVPTGSPRAIARSMMAAYGWGSRQFTCLDKLWMKESSWRVTADNPTSSAYGIPQALPGRKMASAGADWRTNPATQIRWGLGYIDDRYGSPCSAWAHSQRLNWY